jgi:hypothetical protein
MVKINDAQQKTWKEVLLSSNIFGDRVNGLHLYSAFTDPLATKALYILPHIHSLIHTPMAVSAMQGAIQLVGSSWG